MDNQIDGSNHSGSPGSAAAVSDMSSDLGGSTFESAMAAEKNSNPFNDASARFSKDMLQTMDLSDSPQKEASDDGLMAAHQSTAMPSNMTCQASHTTDTPQVHGPPVSTMAFNPDQVDADSYSTVSEYIGKSFNQLVKGNYTEDVTALGTAAQVTTGLIGIDLPGDIRDLAHDLTNWEWSWGHAGKTALDAVGLVPVVGALKYADEGFAIAKNSTKNLDEIADSASVTKTGTRSASAADSKLDDAIDQAGDVKLKTPWQYGPTDGALGTTDKYGNITIKPGLEGKELEETVRHESVHRFLSPKQGPFKELRADIGMDAYHKSHLVRYLEEGAAEAFATGNLRKGLTFPLENGYVSPGRLAMEGAGYLGIAGGGIYLGHEYGSEE